MPAVVRIDGANPTVHCTGTLIAAQWVLTAQHCTNKDAIQGPSHAYPPGSLTVKVNKSAHNAAQTVAVSEIWRMDGYDGDTQANDLAVLKLSTTVADVAPIRIAGAPISVGMNGYAYGFGPTGSRSLYDRVRHPFAEPKPTTFPNLAELKAAGAEATGGCAAIAPSLSRFTTVRGFTGDGDSGGPLLEWSAGVPTLFEVFSSTCGSTKQPSNWVALYSRVDRSSAGWQFVTTYVPELASAGR